MDKPPSSLFNLTLTVHRMRQEQGEHAYLLQDAFSKIGIDIELELIGINPWRFSFQSGEVGGYDQGGYDMFLGSLSPKSPEEHPGDALHSHYHSVSIPPTGGNMMYWSPNKSNHHLAYRAAEKDALITQINTEFNLTKAKDLLYDWQQLWYDVMPEIVILNDLEVHALSSGLYGYDPVFSPFNSIETLFTADNYSGNPQRIVIESIIGDPSPKRGSGRLYYSDWEHQIYITPPFDGLFGLLPSNQLILPSSVDRDQWMQKRFPRFFNTTNFLCYYPRVAKSFGVFHNETQNFTLEIRDDVYWHDGHRLDAWDISFSFQAYLTMLTYSRIYEHLSYPDLVTCFGYDDQINHHGNYSFLPTDRNNDGFYETINFVLNKTDAPLFYATLLQSLLPEHILGDPVNHGYDENGIFDPETQWLVPPSEWVTHSFFTCNPADEGGLKGPIGSGSVVFYDFDKENSTIHLKKFNSLQWSHDQSDWIADAPIQHYFIKDGCLDHMPDEIILTYHEGWIGDRIDHLKSGKINIFGSIIKSWKDWGEDWTPELSADPAIKYVLSPLPSIQRLYMNPKFLQNGSYPLNKKGVRHALSHIIPRQKIATDIFYELALPAYTPLYINSWEALPTDQLISYKRQLNANDGSFPLINCTTAFDDYSLDLALAWLESEGYNVNPWRNSTTTQPNVLFDIPFFSRDFFFVQILLLSSGIGILGLRILKKRKSHPKQELIQ